MVVGTHGILKWQGYFRHLTRSGDRIRCQQLGLWARCESLSMGESLVRGGIESPYKLPGAPGGFVRHQELLSLKDVLLRMDNISAVHYDSKLGG